MFKTVTTALKESSMILREDMDFTGLENRGMEQTGDVLLARQTFEGYQRYEIRIRTTHLTLNGTSRD